MREIRPWRRGASNPPLGMMLSAGWLAVAITACTSVSEAGKQECLEASSGSQNSYIAEQMYKECLKTIDSRIKQRDVDQLKAQELAKVNLVVDYNFCKASRDAYISLTKRLEALEKAQTDAEIAPQQLARFDMRGQEMRVNMQISMLKDELDRLEGRAEGPRFSFGLDRQEATYVEPKVRIAEIKKELASKQAKLAEIRRLPSQLNDIVESGKARQAEIDQLEKILKQNWGGAERFSKQYRDCDANSWPYNKITLADRFLWMSDEYKSPSKPPIKIQTDPITGKPQYCKQILTKVCSVVSGND